MHIELNFPEQKKGEWTLETFYQEGIKYQRVLKNEFLIMANTPNIVEGYIDFLQQAKGSILINGLGMGMCCEYLLNKSTVTDLTVIEYEKELVDFIAPYFQEDERCTILHGDAFTFTPPTGKKYDYVWHDVWFYYTSKNLQQMDVLFEKYKEIANWQGAWARDKCLDLQKKEQKISHT